MSKSNNNTNGGIVFFGLLTILFIGLKLGDIVDWSWWYVLMPMWLPITLALCAIGAIGIFAIAKSGFKK